MSIADPAIVSADASNLLEWARLTQSLFTDHPFEETVANCERLLASGKEKGFLFVLGGKAVAFMNVAIRTDYVNGSSTSPVAFIEGIFVEEGHRRHGIARELLAEAERYAASLGIREIGSDCLVDNATSERFHKSCGFEEKERVICMIRKVRFTESGEGSDGSTD